MTYMYMYKKIIQPFVYVIVHRCHRQPSILQCLTHTLDGQVLTTTYNHKLQYVNMHMKHLKLHNCVNKTKMYYEMRMHHDKEVTTNRIFPNLSLKEPFQCIHMSVLTCCFVMWLHIRMYNYRISLACSTIQCKN